MFNEDNVTEHQKQQVLQKLRSQGIARVEASFSGGNDEGGIDSMTFFDADGNEVEAPVRPHVYRVYTQGRSELRGGDWNNPRLATTEEVAQNLVYKVLEAPVYDKYYTFAGEFYVDGTLTWDITKGTNEMHGSESYTEWASF